MNYKIHLKFVSDVPTKTLAGLMQAMYDENGVAGEFLFDGKESGVRGILFNREAADDFEYINKRLPAGVTLTHSVLAKAAGEQLLAEMVEFDSAPDLQPIFAALRTGCFTMGDPRLMKYAEGLHAMFPALRTDSGEPYPFVMAKPETEGNAPTKTIRIILAALTRVEYTEVLEVPASMSDDEMNDLVNSRYAEVDGGDYRADPDYWDRGACFARPEIHSAAQSRVSVVNGKYELTDIPEPGTINDVHEGAVHVKVEYDPLYTGGDYIEGGTAVSVFIPLSLVNAFLSELKALGGDYSIEDAVHLAFRKQTHMDSMHIVQYSLDAWMKEIAR